MQYKTLLQLVQSVIDSFTNVAVAHLNGLKGYLSKSVFSVKVTNPTTKMKKLTMPEYHEQMPIFSCLRKWYY